MADAVPIVFQVPTAERVRFRAEFGETEENEPDTDVACALLVELYNVCLAVTRGDGVFLTAQVTADTDSIGVLRVSHVPLLSLVACANMQKIGHDSTVHDIRCIFRHPQTRQRLESGCVEIQFWRHSVQPEARRVVLYAPPRPVELVAIPNWNAPQLALGDAHFTTDRNRIITVMRLVYGMYAQMPIGIETSLDLVHPVDFYASNGKRKRTDDRADVKRRNGTRDDSTKTAHVGYCLIFQHNIALPTITAAFMTYLKDQIGPTLLNWVVVFPHTKPIAGSTDKVSRRGESLAVVLRRSDRTDADVAPYSISGAQWLVRRVEKE